MTFATFIRTAARRRIPAAVTGASAAVVRSAAAFPAPAEPAEGRMSGAGAPGAVSGGYVVTLKQGATAAGTLTRTYGGGVGETFRTALNGYSLRATATQARRLAADPAVGTSMATPHVAGAAALYLAAHPAASPAQVASALTAGAAKDRVSNEGLFTPNLLLQVPKG